MGYGIRKTAFFMLLAALLAVCCFVSQGEGAQVQGTVWEDTNGDGLKKDEKGLGKVKVTLEKENGGAAGAVTTGSDGAFSFSSVPSGRYRLRFELPSGYFFTFPGRDSAALPAVKNKSATPVFSVKSDGTVEKNAGAGKASGKISLLAFLDNDMNTKKALGESGMGNVEAQLIYEQDGAEYVIATAVTDSKGAASFRTVSPGEYRIRVKLPRNFVVGPTGNAMTAQQNCFQVGENQTGLTDPFTVKPKGSVGVGVGMVRGGDITGEMWFDENHDGVRDKNEPAFTDASLSLSSDILAAPITASPDENGAYAFRHLQPGKYLLTVALPDGTVFTYPGESLITSLTSTGEADVAAEASAVTVLPPIGAMPAIPQQITLSLYVDANGNGQWDEGEAPLPGAEISVSRDGKVLDRARTDEEGGAHFTLLRSGSMVLAATLPEGYVMLPVENGLFDTSTAGSTAFAALSIADREERLSLSAPVIAASAITGRMYPVQEGKDDLPLNDLLAGVSVQAVNAQGRAVQTVRANFDGSYRLSPLPAGEYAVRFLLPDSCEGVTTEEQAASRIVSTGKNQADTERISLIPGQTAENVDGGVRRRSLENEKPLSVSRVDDIHLSLEGGQRLVNDAAAHLPGSVKSRMTGFNEAIDAMKKKLGAGCPKVYFYLVESSMTHQIARTFPEDSPLYEYLKKNLHADVFDHLKYTTYEEFCHYFYATDHHWNFAGSYRGYLDVVKMLLGEDETPLTPVETIELPIVFNGSFARLTNRPVSKENFTLYRFDPFPRYTATINGRKKAYDHLQEYLNHKYSSDLLANHYAFCYGGDVGLLILESRDTRNGRTLLMLGNSLANPVKTLLTAHYEKIVYVDLRHYQKACQKDFSLRETVQKYGVDQILLLGDMSFFLEGDKPLP